MSSPHFPLQKAYRHSRVLEKLGYQPQKIRDNDYWYLSPLREEKQASFKVNRKLNAWYDHGSGIGGNIARDQIDYLNKELRIEGVIIDINPSMIVVKDVINQNEYISEAFVSVFRIGDKVTFIHIDG